jgi:GNAT superfamily N-acetyltransferase
LTDRAARIVIAPARTPDDLSAARELFIEYVSAPGWEAGFARYLVQQEFATEVATLPGPYAPPGGALLLARVDERIAGCVACKAWDAPTICEMKRLFVRPDFRGLGVGGRLVMAIIRAARAAGYHRMRLDTLPSMHDAQRLYSALGFTEIPAYCENPVPGARFLECDLLALAAAERPDDLGA